MTRRIALFVLLIVTLSGSAIADDAQSLSVYTYQFKHKVAEKAAAAIKALVSAEGTVSIQPATNSIVVSDRAANIKDITAALQKYDTPPQPVKLNVRLATASRQPAPVTVPESLRDIAPKLEIMRYNALEGLGVANVDTREGEPALIELSNGYRADFRVGEYDPASDTIQLTDFKLAKMQGDQLTQVYRTTLNVKVGQTLIIGATRDPQSQKALIVVVSAKR